MTIETFADVLDLVAGAIDSSSEVQGYCSTAWGKACRVYIDIDKEAAPDLALAPMVHIDPALRSREVDGYMEHLFVLGVFVESGDYVQQTGTNIYKRPGRDRLEALAQLVEHAATLALEGASIPAPMEPTDPDMTWGTAGQGVFYTYRIRFRDPLY